MRAVKLFKIRKKEGEREKKGRKERVRKKRIKNEKKIKGFDCFIQKPGSRIQDFKAEMSITIYLMIKNITERT